jgi:hypothetical protein
VEILYEAFTKAEAAVAGGKFPNPHPDKEASAFQDTKLSIFPTDNTILSILNNDTAVSAYYIIEQEDGKSRCCERR